jgi:hypothetical protein
MENEFIDIFDDITLIILECDKALKSLIPKSGADIFVASVMSESAITHFEEIDTEEYIKAFRIIRGQLEKVNSLAEKLSIISKDNPLTEQGIKKIVDDIADINAIGTRIHYDAYTAYSKLPNDSPKAKYIKESYEVAVLVYSNIAVAARRAYPKGRLIPVLPLKSITTPPV